MEARSPARFLAPIALVATIAGAYLVVHHGSTAHRSAAAPRRLRSGGRVAPPPSQPAKPHFYRVQQGDSFSLIAAKTGVALASLEALNPGTNPNTLQTGQRIRLRR